MGVNDYFGPRRTNILHVITNYGYLKDKFEIDYYRQAYCSLEKMANIWGKLEKPGQ